jgi:hypothetical protein
MAKEGVVKLNIDKSFACGDRLVAHSSEVRENDRTALVNLANTPLCE